MTLEDIALHLWLPINGNVVIGGMNFNVPMLQDMCQWLLRRWPEVGDFDGCAIRLSWLTQNFTGLKEDANEHIIQCYARAYIL